MAHYAKIDPVWLELYGHEPTFDDIWKFFGHEPTFDDIWKFFGYKPPVIPEYGEPKYNPEETCFAYEPKAKTGCEALKMQYCRYGKCSFYKTREQYDEERKKYVSDKYGGK